MIDAAFAIQRLTDLGVIDVARSICIEEQAPLGAVIRQCKIPAIVRARSRLLWTLHVEHGVQQKTLADILDVGENTIWRCVHRHALCRKKRMDDPIEPADRS